MSDFKKRSDVAPAPDDSAPIPSAPFSIAQDVPALDGDQSQDDVSTNREAAPRWHPAWESVQEKFEAVLEAYDGNNIIQFKDLDADEFKIKVLANQVVREEVKKIMEDVQRAVESVEQRPKPGKQSKPGS